MKKIRRMTAILCALAMLLSSLPIGAIMADDGDEDGQVVLASEPRKGLLGNAAEEKKTNSLLGEFHIHLQGRDTVTLSEIFGDIDQSNMGIYDFDMSPSGVAYNGWDPRRIENLNLVSSTSAGSAKVTIFDGNWNYYKVYFYQDHTWKVKATGTVTLADLLEGLGLPSTYAAYDVTCDTAGGNSVSYDSNSKTFTVSALPVSPVLFSLRSGDNRAFGISFIMETEEGLFSYRFDESAGTATITGFSDNAEDSDKADIVIPASVTAPDGKKYQVTAIAEKAFRRNTQIKNVTINAPKLSIGNNAFEYCSALQRVTDACNGKNDRLTIGEYAFGDCSALEYFESEAGIDLISNKAFYNAESLKKFTAGAGCKTQFGWTNAFQCATGELVFNGGIYDISGYTFYDSGVTKITTTGIDSMNWVSLYASRNSVQLELNISETVEELTAETLSELIRNASWFKKVTLNLNGGVNLIKAGAFSDIHGYDEFIINVADNGSTTTIEEGAVPEEAELEVHFAMYRRNVIGSEKLTALEDGGILYYLDGADDEFSYHDDMFWYDVAENKAVITGVYQEEGAEPQKDLVFADKTRDNRYPVTGVSAELLKGDSTVESLTFTNKNELAVGEDAFRGMTALKYAAVNGTLTELPDNAFAGCSALETVIFGTTEDQHGTMTLPDGGFSGCSALTTFICHINSVTVKKGVFDGCTGLTTVIMTGHGSQKIESGAFAQAKGLKTLRLDNPYDIGTGAFDATAGTTFIQSNDAPLNGSLPARIGYFENYVFAGNTPWWMSSAAFSGKAPKRIYMQNAGRNISEDLKNALNGANSALTDVYLDCEREAVNFADDLDAASGDIRVHYRENHLTAGIYLDGVKGDDAGDGSMEHPFRTFERALQAANAMDPSAAETLSVEDTTAAAMVDTACRQGLLTLTAGTFTDYYTAERAALVLNTVTVSEAESWNSGSGEPLLVLRDASFKGALVKVTGSLTLANVILDGNNGQVTAEAPLVSVQGGTLNLESGAVLRNNNFPQSKWDGYNWTNGGAVFAQGGTVNVRDGSLIECNLAMYGGGIQMYGGTLNMTGGTIRYNTAKATAYANNVKVNGNGGGVLLISGATMYLSGGSITENRADGWTSSGVGISGSTGGGIQVGGSYNDLVSNSSLIMTDGSVSGNSAYAEGGGIYINASTTATVSGGSITGNSSGRGEFGGGGFYVNGARGNGTSNGLLKLNNVLITDNDAYYGGGIACCETVNLTLYMGSGAAIYGNGSSSGGYGGDLFLFMRRTGKGTKAKLSQTMMNGADYNWTWIETDYSDERQGFRTGERVPEDLLAYLNAGSTGTVLLKSNPSNTSASASVIISGNRAKTKGGGIGSNGNVVIGEAPPATSVTMTVDASKLVTGRDMKEGETFRFSVYLETTTRGDVLYENETYYNVNNYTDQLLGTGTVTMAKEGRTVKVSLPSYTVERVTDANLGAQYTLLVFEEKPEGKHVLTENRYLAFVYVIGQNGNSYEARLARVEEGKMSYDEDGKPVFDYGEGYHPIGGSYWKERLRTQLSDSVTTFTNVLLDRTAEARKEWRGADGKAITPPENASVTFELMADGKAAIDLDGKPVKAITLDGKADKAGEAEAWKAVWENLPIFRDADLTEKIVYTVKETAVTPATVTVNPDAQTAPEGGETVIVNTYTPPETPPTEPPAPETTSVTVRKVWNDNNNAANQRPKQIVMTLSNGMRVTLNDANGWSATISNLPVTDDLGQTITYTWKEQAVIGYDQTGMTTAGTETTFTNTLWQRPETPATFKPKKAPGREFTEFHEYETPLGVEIIINHVGDCFD